MFQKSRNEPRSEKTYLWPINQGQTQAGLRSYIYITYLCKSDPKLIFLHKII